jgi:hypothetical protein
MNVSAAKMFEMSRSTLTLRSEPGRGREFIIRVLSAASHEAVG